MIVAIDGPAGSGKTTVAQKLSEKLNFSYLDTGATYRTLTYAALEEGLDLSREAELAALADSLDLRLEGEKVYLRGADISRQIRTPLIDKNISQVAALKRVREVMRQKQRAMAQGKDCVVEGRDITTVVFPDSDFKFYLDADQKVRAQRRIDQMKGGEEKIDCEEIEKDLIKRDKADLSREVGSLKLSEDARYIDTTSLSIEGVVDKLFSIIKGKPQSEETKESSNEGKR